jgi:rSAM/selenodomain-associated transferase 1
VVSQRGNLLLVFTKNAVLGEVKTRLASDIGNEEALRVHQALVERTVLKVNQCNCDKVVYYSNEIEASSIFFENGYRQEVQSEGDLGERMQQAFSKEFANGYRSIVIIGTDCPEIDEASISLAFTHLEEKDVILGPAHDGGYYLLGLSALHNALFDDIAWGTSKVFQSTVDRVHKLSLSLSLTAKKQDIDTLDDLKKSDFGKVHFPWLIG